MLLDSILDCIGCTPMVHLSRLFPTGPRVYAKLELLNPAGSVKDRTARYIIETGLREGVLYPGAHIVESTSGNFGVALSMMSRIYGLRLTLVVDPHITKSNYAILKSYGAQVEMVDDPTTEGGYLPARIARVKEILARDSAAVWINQYANALGPEAHYRGTAEEISRDLRGPLDYLVVAVSTTGTLNGLARRLKERDKRLEVIAVDAVGSVVFGNPPGPRRLPGIGSSRVPELLDRNLIDRVVEVTDDESITACHEILDREAIFAGASSGSVIAAIKKILPEIPASSSVVTLFPDRGDRYIDVVYGAEAPSPVMDSVATPAHGAAPLIGARAGS
ncbi:2,3-diaminopropionate biosynthesis protein SbnA [Streptomyces fulvoviolaceus]|uniref:2,3-diaminopropionate biosynthesis protein SbnA n=1 Tax=Streptomyces fulvoviolaceus TaxID=285535 RepID=UPI00069380D7|nr:2,3-diaminopropionate biosynthesis protein SbnA [Streptomyces fulvoviolaceus]MCT9077921.1 2,3-diaminopropionate biosynthesis protein SbnA [Streptomyces fulvoviolaceus]